MKTSLRPPVNPNRSAAETEGSTRSPTNLYVGQDDMRVKGLFKNTTNNLKKSNVGPSGTSSRGFTNLGE